MRTPAPYIESRATSISRLQGCNVAYDAMPILRAVAFYKTFPRQIQLLLQNEWVRGGMIKRWWGCIQCLSAVAYC